MYEIFSGLKTSVRLTVYILSTSFQFCEFRFDLLEGRQCARVIVAFRILNYAIPIDDKHCAFRDATHPEIHLRQKRVVGDAISPGDVVLIVAEERDRDLFLLGPRFLGERIIAANSINSRVETAVGG